MAALYSTDLFFSLWLRWGWVLCSDAESKDPDGKFSPNILNTVVYLASSAMTIATFLANYRVLLGLVHSVVTAMSSSPHITCLCVLLQGHPFMIKLTDNKMLVNGLLYALGAIAVMTLEIFPSFNEFLELAPLPSFQVTFACCYRYFV